jgi:two-component system NtrC family sensor kinase
MRKIAVTACLFLLTFMSMAQHVNVDSLQKLADKTTDPSKKYNLLSRINREYFINGRGDYLVENSLAMVKVALQLNDNEKIAYGYNALGDYYAYVKGDNTTALDYLFKAIPYAEKLSNSRELPSVYADISVAYEVLGNFGEDFRFLQKAEASLPTPANPDYWYLKMQVQLDFASHYSFVKNTDKLIVYLRSVEQINARLKYPTWDLFVKTLYGSYYAQLGKTELARQAFKQALVLDKTNQYVFAHFNIAAHYIPFLIENKEFEQARQQAYNLLHLGVANGNNDIRLRSSEYLRYIYEKDGKVDSAYNFAKEALILKDTILKQTLLNKERALNFNEEVRVEEAAAQQRQKIQTVVVFSVISVVAIIALLLYRNSRQRKKANIVLEGLLADLKSTQGQLIQSAKMASLGELTAGIAHEIQNPLNFVNNFSEVNAELVGEMKLEIDKGDLEEIKAIATDIEENSRKINQHGHRADAIVKGMLQHSRTSSGQKALTDLNTLADEYLRLAYHGLRAKDKDFNADLITRFDEKLPKVNVSPQDIGRVMLNLFNNAFYAVNQKSKTAGADYKPTVEVKTSATNEQVQISVKDNGNGIPHAIKDKIMQPFFTTKPTGEGTGLGLSLSYDIVVKGYGGSIAVDSTQDEGSVFTVYLPII